MKLDEYMKINRGLKKGFVAEEIGLSYSQLSLVLHGKRRPSNSALILIEKLTNGQVTAKDYGKGRSDPAKEEEKNELGN